MADGIQDPNLAQQQHDPDTMALYSDGKGKGRAAEANPDTMMDDEEDDEDDSEDDEGDEEAPDEDNMEEIDTDNIVGARTRGKNIDYAQAAKDLGDEADDDEEDDEDFVADDDQMED